MISTTFAPAVRSSAAHPRNAAFGLRSVDVRIASSELRLKL